MKRGRIRSRHALLVTQTAHCWGGVEVWLSSTVKALLDAEWAVTMGLVRGARFHIPEGYPRPSGGKFDVVEIDGRGGTSALRLRAITKVVRKVRPDVVAPVNIGEVLGAVRFLRREQAALRVLYPVHGLLGCQFLDARRNRDVIDLAVTPSRLAARALSTISGIEPSRARWAPAGCPIPEGGRVRDRSPRPLRLAWIGRLTDVHKRVSDAASVLEQLAAKKVECVCDIIGDGEAAPVLRRRLAPLIRAGRVSFLGHVSREMLYGSVYPSLDVLVITSECETGPLVAWEALLHGVAVVSTKYVGALTEGALVDGETALLREIGDVEGLADCVARLALDRDLAARLGDAGRELVLARYTEELAGKAWLTAFEDVLDRPRSGEHREEVTPRPAGRLDRVLGGAAGGLVRRAIGRVPTHSEPGAEWPHTVSVWPGGEDIFRRELALMESTGAAAGTSE
jgi:glycosyltransferase involved in cell wall biosynthesis